MQTFNWNNNYSVGIDAVDDEHKELVNIINQLGDLVESGEDDPDSFAKTLEGLLSYTQYHFDNEEKLMADTAIDQRHIEQHKQAHSDFVGQVNKMVEKLPSSDAEILSYHNLLDFLIHWLVFHILDIDQKMAHQIEAISKGKCAAEAYTLFNNKTDITTEPLYAALNVLFERVNARNQALIELNQTLESKVEERTKELNESNRRLTELSITDSLTNLPNRRYAMIQLEQHWQEACDKDYALTNIMIDADHFKEVNDKYGHDAGDFVLQSLAKELRHAFRNDDVVCRLGGDEFYVICPRTDLAGGLRIAEIVQERISKLRVNTGKSQWEGSISVGVAAKTLDVMTYDELLKQADLSVYKAKEKGKNCVQSVQSD